MEPNGGGAPRRRVGPEVTIAWFTDAAMRRALAGFIVLVATLVPSLPSHATAQFGYTALAPILRTKVVAVRNAAPVQATASCPKGSKTLTGGAFFFERGQNPDFGLAQFTRLADSFPTPQGWTAIGYRLAGAPSDTEMAVDVKCTRAPIDIRTVRASTTLVPFESAALTLECPSEEGVSMTPITTGVSFRRPGLTMLASARRATLTGISLSIPLTFSGTNNGSKPLVMNVEALCSFSLTPVVVSTATTSAIAPGQTVGGYVACLSGNHALSGALSFTNSSGAQIDAGVAISGLSPTFDGNGAYSAGEDVNRSSIDEVQWWECLPDS